MSQIKVGSVIRYSRGPTALMKVSTISENHDGKVTRYYGEQIYGGTVAAYADDCSLATEKDMATWAIERKLYNIGE